MVFLPISGWSPHPIGNPDPVMSLELEAYRQRGYATDLQGCAEPRKVRYSSAYQRQYCNEVEPVEGPVDHQVRDLERYGPADETAHSKPCVANGPASHHLSKIKTQERRLDEGVPPHADWRRPPAGARHTCYDTIQCRRDQRGCNEQ